MVSELTTEDLVTFKFRSDSMQCEFCTRPAKMEVEVSIHGRRTRVLICGECKESRMLISEEKT